MTPQHKQYRHETVQVESHRTGRYYRVRNSTTNVLNPGTLTIVPHQKRIPSLQARTRS